MGVWVALGLLTLAVDAFDLRGEMDVVGCLPSASEIKKNQVLNKHYAQLIILVTIYKWKLGLPSAVSPIRALSQPVHNKRSKILNDPRI